MLRRAYASLRQEDSTGTSNYRITVRQLESLIRLSEALARVNLALEIDESHVIEATRLLNCSILKVHKSDYTLEGEKLVEANGKSNGVVQEPNMVI